MIRSSVFAFNPRTLSTTIIMTCPRSLLLRLLLVSVVAASSHMDMTTDSPTQPDWDKEMRSIASEEMQKAKLKWGLITGCVGVGVLLAFALAFLLLYKLVFKKQRASAQTRAAKRTNTRTSSRKRQRRHKNKKKTVSARSAAPKKGAMKYGQRGPSAAPRLTSSATPQPAGVSMTSQSQMQTAVAMSDQPAVLHMTDDSGDNNQVMDTAASQDSNQFYTPRPCTMLDNDCDIELGGQGVGIDQRRVRLDQWDLSDSTEDRHVCTSDDVITYFEY